MKVLTCVCTFTFNLISATSRMISTPTYTSGSNYIKLTWTRPRYLPTVYELKYVCSMKNNSGHHSSSTDVIKTRLQYLNLDCCSITIFDLYPKSICIVNLITVYNPASSDDGIVIIVTNGKLNYY